MIPVTLDALDHYALAYLPDPKAGYSATFRVETEQVESLTKREARRALGATLRVVDFSASYALDRAPAAELRSALRVIAQDNGEKLVRVPFWPAAQSHTGFSSRWFMSYDDGAAIGAVDNVTFDDEAGGVPTLLGYLAEAPKFPMRTPEFLRTTVRFKESSPATEALVPDAQVWTAGPVIGGRTIYVFPFDGDWAKSQDAGIVDVDVLRAQLGFTREAASQAYPQIGRRRPVFSFNLKNGEASKLLRFFLDRNGPVQAFWLPGYLAEVKLAADTSSGSNQITVNDATLIADHGYLAFYKSSGAVVARKITGRAGNVLTLESSPGDLTMATTSLFSLMLCRFASSELTVRFKGPSAVAQIEFCELPQEYATPGGETYGTNLGALPAKSFLFKIVHGAETWRWTNYEADQVDGAANTWTKRQIEHTDIVDGSVFDSSESSFRMRHYAGNPFTRALTGALTEPVEVFIYECVPGAPVTGVTLLFHGFAQRPRFNGAFVDVPLTNYGELFKTRIPVVLLQPQDNWPLFLTANSMGNRLTKADWTFSALVTAANGRTLTLGTVTWPGGALPAMAANYFALGYVERPAPNYARIPIISSTLYTAGALTVELSYAPAAITLNEAGWKFIPGYDGAFATARDKFGNGANFAGFPFMPTRTPTLVGMKKTDSRDTKK